jgi:hypothetical protein
VVFVICQGDEFQGEIDKVWKLNDILMKEPEKVHKNAINYNIETVNKNTIVQSWQTNTDNQITKNKMQFTTYFSLGVTVEILQGKLEGSKAFVYYSKRRNNSCNSSRRF